ncbi:hypothetical protein [Microbulbifer sp. GL-2]|uniref:hypothetical protein n=1 Tax=Microbulbifer sp. GL-2 TaxID=2591606 RepID=UPI00117EBABC|nr:hypothetical protein [Microbulbifer sp. GL-2]
MIKPIQLLKPVTAIGFLTLASLPIAGNVMAKTSHSGELISASGSDLSVSNDVQIKVIAQDVREIIRKQLYYNEADTVSGDDENPNDGVYSRDKAAFRYLDLMYILNENTESVFNPYFSGELQGNFSDLFDAAERSRAAQVEAFVFDQLAIDPNNESLQHAILDVYYDRAVAEMILANEFLDRAVNSRLQNESVDVEIEHTKSAYQLLKGALAQYEFLLDSSSGYLSKWASSRGQTSPRYFDPAEMQQRAVAPEEILPGSYKDVTMLYQLMGKLASVKAEQVRLAIMSGQDDSTLSAEMIEEVNTLHSDLVSREETLRALFPEADFTQFSLDTGLPQAVNLWHAHIVELESSVAWLEGDSNFLGLSWGAVPQGLGSNAKSHTFDTLSDLIGKDSGPIARAQESLNTAKADFDDYIHSVDSLTEEFAGRRQRINTRLSSLLGVFFPEGCYVESCAVANYQSRINSELFHWSRNINNIQASLARNLQRLEGRLDTIESEVEQFAQIEGENGALSKLIIDYGSQQIPLSQQVNRIRDKREEFNSRAALFESLVSALNDYNNGRWIDIDSLSSHVMGVKKTINELGNFEQLQAMNAILAAEHRAILSDSTGNMLSDGNLYRLQSLWLEANAIAFDIAQAETTLVQEAKRLPPLLNQAKIFIAQLTMENPDLALRHFADPINSHRDTANLLQTEYDLERAQKWLFHAVNALENKWQHASFERESGVSRGEILRLRSADELWSFHNKMKQFNSGIATPEKYTDTFSIKEDVFGYKDRVNGVQQTYLHPDPEQRSGPRISALEAFQETLRLLSRTFGQDTYVTIEFSTVKEPLSANLFNGPIISGRGTDSACIAVGGNYRDKIESVELSIPVSYNISGESETVAYLTYGGASVFRQATPGSEVVNEDETIGVEGEFNSYSVLSWDVVGDSQLVAGNNIQKASMKAGLNIFGNNSGSISSVTTLFNEQSIAATGWRLSFLLEDVYGKVVDLKAIRDVELIFEHSAKSRNYSNCSGGSSGGPL